MPEPIPLEDPVPLSQSVLWTLQRRYFEQTGPAAWRKSEVPHYVTTNAYLARAYARVFAGYVEDALAAGPEGAFGRIDRAHPVNIVELGAGSGRLGFLLARELAELSRERDLPRFRVIVTDFAEANVVGFAARPEFAELLALGQVDFAIFDADEPAPLTLRHSGEVLGAGSLANPLGVVANYVVDTLRQDAFAIRDGRLLEIVVQACLPAEGRAADDSDASKDVTLLRKSRPATLPYYDDPVLDSLLERYRDGLTDTEVVVPVGAIRALRFLLDLADDRVCLIAGDKGYRRLTDLDKRPIGDLVKHGSFSMMANLDAVSHVFGARGGTTLHHSNRYTRFTISAFAATAREPADLRRFQAAYTHDIDGFGPAEYHRLYKMLKEFEAPRIALILLLLRLSAFDPTMFSRYAGIILESVSDASRAIQQDVAVCIDQVVARSYPVSAKDDAVFLAGRVLYRCQRPAEAAALFERVVAEQPERHVAWYNLGLCMERQARPDEARRCYQAALSLAPDYERAQRALGRVG
jgi:tetratricopeptide (TPR) repeat protein